ncbi:30S ribosomal protein S7 [Candidatus Woesearchaeota archaeon CG10_big_fil_rev_8_21_14_0_10_37_12]|nr:MAG: 30S ribosomal protein S7 [Candidatus Woesearchaeota archaeon CG10_big_fil_rev_8_21_14_0_10_37_12]
MSILTFNRWSVGDVSVEDSGLQRYISLEPRFVPKTGARYAGKRFHKSRTFIVERLINKISITGHKSKKHFKSSGHMTGKSTIAYNAVRTAFEIIEKKLNENPIKVLVRAIENAAPREEIVAIEYGGARYPKAVDCAPQRRVDIALRYFCQGAYDKCFKKKKALASALADELIGAFNLDGKTMAIVKKLEIERQADASR